MMKADTTAVLPPPSLFTAAMIARLQLNKVFIVGVVISTEFDGRGTQRVAGVLIVVPT